MAGLEKQWMSATKQLADVFDSIHTQLSRQLAAENDDEDFDPDDDLAGMADYFSEAETAFDNIREEINRLES